jgi:abequosyltransferase
VKPKLSIAIPTYNRRNLLEETLNSVFSQITSQVELIICDNASTDDTEVFIKEYIEKYTYVKYFRNQKNIGMDRNFLTCLEKSTGDYVLMLSDDDLLDKNAVSNLLSLIENSKNDNIGIISLNVRTINDGVLLYNNNDIQIFSHDEIAQYYKNVGIMLTFISSIVYNRKLFEQVQKKRKYLDTYLFVTGMIFQILSLPDVKSCILPATIINARQDNSGGINFYNIFIIHWKKVLFSDENRNIKKKVLRKIYKKTLKSYISVWMIKFKDKKYKHKYEASFKMKHFFTIIWFKETWIYILPILILPYSIIRFFLRLRNLSKRSVIKRVN